MSRLDRGGRVDRSRVIAFRFDGKAYQGLQGDTLASALLANGVRLVARSFKYHRPRGILSAGVEEPNALVQLFEGARTIPNARATEVELVEGLVHVKNMTDDYYEFDSRRRSLIGSRRRKRYTLGDRIRVVVSRVDLAERKLDFVIATP